MTIELAAQEWLGVRGELLECRPGMDVPRRDRGESKVKTTLFTLRNDPRDTESDGSFH